MGDEAEPYHSAEEIARLREAEKPELARLQLEVDGMNGLGLPPADYVARKRARAEKIEALRRESGDLIARAGAARGERYDATTKNGTCGCGAFARLAIVGEGYTGEPLGVCRACLDRLIGELEADYAAGIRALPVHAYAIEKARAALSATSGMFPSDEEIEEAETHLGAVRAALAAAGAP